MTQKQSKIVLWLKELRIPFCAASIMPVIVGAAVAFADKGDLNIVLFVLAICAMVAIHFGANVANDYFDHLSRNDWLNDNRTAFSGGSGLIPNNQLSPKEVLIGSWILLAIGAGFGIAIAIITKSLFVLFLGLIGVLGAYFYTAPPLKLGYRTAGEIMIGFLFGILPVYGSFYIQTLNFSALPIPAAAIVAVLIFLVIFANEFPDFWADREADKKTLVVSMGINNAVALYQSVLIILCVLCVVYAMGNLNIRASAVLQIPVFIFSAMCFRYAKVEKLSQKGYSALSKATIALHIVGCIALSAAILLQSRTF